MVTVILCRRLCKEHVAAGLRKVVVFALLLATALVAAVSVAAVDAPTVTTTGYINGAMNIAVAYKDGLEYQVQMKGPGETDYSFVEGVFAKFNSPTYPRTCWTFPVKYGGSAAFRIRAMKDEEYSDWVDCGEHKATVSISGKIIGTPGTAGVLANAYDGAINTFVDAGGNSGNDRWVGYLFDEPVTISKIRYIPRLDLYNVLPRYQSSLFQASDNGTFDDARLMYQVSATFGTVNKISEAVLSTAVTALAVRHYKELGGYEQSAEIEYIPTEMPLRPVLTLDGRSDWTNFYPCFTCSFPDARFMCVKWRLERQVVGKERWKSVTGWFSADGKSSFSLTDETATVGQPCRYRVTAETGHPDFVGQMKSSIVVDYTRMRRLDRSEAELERLLPGVTYMKLTNGTECATMPRAFDGNALSWPDIGGTYRMGPIGLNFHEKTWVKAFSYICRSDSISYQRIRNAALYCAAGDEDGTELVGRVKCSNNPAPAATSQDTTLYHQEATFCPEDGAECWFLYENMTGYGGGFYGNVAEFGLYGWTQSDVNAAMAVPGLCIIFR